MTRLLPKTARKASTPARSVDEPLTSAGGIEAGEILDRLAVAAWIFDIDASRVVWANRSALDLWRAATPDELRARDMKADMSASVARRLKQYQDDFQRTQAVFSELWTLYPEGRARTVRVLFSGFMLADGRMGMFCEARDEVDPEPERLRSSDALLHTPVMISLYTMAGEPLYRNPAARAAASDHGRVFRQRFNEAADYDTLAADLKRLGEVSRVARVSTQAGSRWHEVTVRECHDAVTGQAAILVSEVDVTDLKNTQAKAQYLAHHDPLTSLPNRASVSRHFENCIAEARVAGETVGVLFLDLDAFKIINDSLGHAVGDDVLRCVAQRLLTLARCGMVTIRLGGDEFLIIVAGGHCGSLEAIASEAIQALSEPMLIGHHRLSLTTSIGISRFPQDGVDGTTLMKNADLAMYEAKEAGRNCFRHFSIALRDRADHRLNLQSDIKAALANNHFEVHYQPRVSLADNRVVGAEALLRWRHPDRGMILPSVFIPLAEETGLIEELGRFVMREAMREQRKLADAGTPINISINVSQRQLSADNFLDIVLESLGEAGCAPEYIEFEITESMLTERTDVPHIIDRVRELGIRISIDDFGTGYSNLARLHEFAIDCVKIDRAFVVSLPGEKALAQIIISLCKLMHVKIVAEGVENRDQLDWLRNRGCDEYQGFYFARAMTAAAFMDLLANQRRT